MNRNEELLKKIESVQSAIACPQAGDGDNLTTGHVHTMVRNQEVGTKGLAVKVLPEEAH